MTRPLTRTARLAEIASILARTRVRSQEELAEILAERGVSVTQTTLSRDLEELGAVRLRSDGGALVYAIPGRQASSPFKHPPGEDAGLEKDDPSPDQAAGSGEADGASGTLAGVTAELLLSAETSGNLLVVRTLSGGAQFLASAIDRAAWTAILGTVAGDDTVVVVARDAPGAERVAQALLRLAGKA